MKRYLLVLNILFITVAIYFSIIFFYKIMTEDINNINLISVTSKENITYQEDENQKNLSYYSPIIERNLLKTKKDSNGILKDKINLEALRHTDLNLRLWGTVTADDKQTVYAVIEEQKAKKQSLYRVGDKIQNATVKMIFREKVVLNVNGRDEILEIEELSENKKSSNRR